MELEKATPYLETNPTDKFQGAGLYLLGVCFDGTTSFRPGARLGPNALREASVGIETYSPYLDLDTEDYDIYDLGNLPFVPSKVEKVYENFETQIAKGFDPEKMKLLTIGGEHSIAYAPIKYHLQQYPELVLIHLDAHADLRDGYLEEHYSHASVIRRVLDHFEAGHELIQYGIRSGTKEEYIWMREHHTLVESRSEFLRQVESIENNRPIYLTLDLDYFDPAYLPGTGTPEAGGEDFHSFVSLMKILKNKNLVGADIVELAPQLDSTGNSSVLAAKTAREIMLSLMA